MAFISLDDSNALVVHDCYDQKKLVSDMGGQWDPVSRTWKVVFTMSNLESLIDGFDVIGVDDSVEAAALLQGEKEQRLERLREMSKADVPVRLMIPGLKVSLYNYQKLGVMYSVTNGVGVLLADEMGLGKALAEGTEVYTPYGRKNIEDIRVGDEVIGSDGCATRVMGFYPQGRRKAYRVSFSDGASVDCCKEHLWQVNTATRKNRGNPSLVKTTEEIIEDGLVRRNGKNGERWNWYIPLTKPVNFVTRSIILDELPPYVLGILMGDGALSNGRIGFSSGDSEIIERVESLMGKDWHVRKCGGKYDYEISRISFRTACQDDLVHKFLRERGLKRVKSPDKWIPDEYLYSPLDDRLELLRGLLDSDGTVSKGERGNACVFSTTSSDLRDAVVWLCRSLGGTASCGRKSPFYYKDGKRIYCREAWNVTVSLPGGMCPFYLKRKASEYLNCRLKYPPSRAITSIERVGEKEMYCIAVDAEDSLYVTKDFVVTHNTIQAISTALMLKFRGLAKKGLIVTPASLKFNWPLEIEKFTDEKYVIIDGSPDERVAQWLRDDVFFYVVNSELVLEDLFGGREFKAKKGETPQQAARRKARIAKAKARERILGPVRRRMWDFIAVDECFPYYTPVITDRGIIPIGQIVENCLNVSVLSCDFSTNELSYKKVVRYIDKPLAGCLVEIKHEFGSLVCTENHRVWTEEDGYVEAGKIKRDGVTHLRVVRGGVSGTEEGEVYPEILQSQVFEQMETISAVGNREDSREAKNAGEKEEVQGVSWCLRREDCKGTGESFLFKEVQCDLEDEARGRVGHQDAEDAQGKHEGYQGREESIGFFENEDVKSRPCVQKESDGRCCEVEGEQSVIYCQRREAVHNGASEDFVSDFGRGVDTGVCGCRQVEDGGSNRVSPEFLSDRYCSSGIEDCSGSRWKDSQDSEMESNRWQEEQGFVLSRVVGVEILERGDYAGCRGGSEEGQKVYNLEVEDNHNYVADGVLVSNCQMLKSHSSKRSRNVKQLRAKFKMALTGTPMDGKLEELHSVMGFVAPGLLGSKMRFFQKHVETDFYGKVTGYKRLSEVTSKIQPFFIRRLKRDVLEDLPDKIYENKVVILSKQEADIYKKLASNGHEATEDAEAVVAVIRCKQFCNWPGMIDDECRKFSKMDAFKEVLDEVVIENGNQALVFSQYKEMLDVIATHIKGMGLKYLRIDGDTDKRDRADYQKVFKEDKTIDLMIGTEAMSTGLNLTAASYVINYDDNWAPAVMAQREDRAHRIGQLKGVTVINFICKNTIEERIRDVIYAKSKVTATVLGDDIDEMVLKRLGPKDVAKLL